MHISTGKIQKAKVKTTQKEEEVNNFIVLS